MQLPGGGYVLIDYEHSGLANAVPLFEPLGHWPLECREPGAVYTPAADIHCVGGLMDAAEVFLDAPASALRDPLTAEEPAARPSASEAILDPWLLAG